MANFTLRREMKNDIAQLKDVEDSTASASNSVVELDKKVTQLSGQLE